MADRNLFRDIRKSVKLQQLENTARPDIKLVNRFIQLRVHQARNRAYLSGYHNCIETRHFPEDVWKLLKKEKLPANCDEAEKIYINGRGEATRFGQQSLGALEERFEREMNDPAIVAASMVHPIFKNCWTVDGIRLDPGINYSKMRFQDGSHSSEEEFDDLLMRNPSRC
ncbi:hypothetical protein Ciccas_012037 [Cichlidogyrus casuarinus]|uniref:Uncharacterized protein n=1 Tax=Cichlidogyrus casuarinus TaxID=1844966 RepID=A0ABD2PQT1_9PLAT